MKFTATLLITCVLLPFTVAGQTGAEEVLITLRGTVYDVNDSLARPSPIVINKRTGSGVASPGGGIFAINGLKSDTFRITAGGYEVINISFRDSVLKPVYTVRIGLKMRL